VVKRLNSPIIHFLAVYSGAEVHLAKLKKTSSAENDIELAVGAQVMLTRNLEAASKLANGSRGVITAFHSSGFPMVLDPFPPATKKTHTTHFVSCV